MSGTQQVLAAGPRISVKAPRRPPGYRHLHGSDFAWTIAFVLPYVGALHFNCLSHKNRLQPH